MYRVLVVEDDEREGRSLCGLLDRYAREHDVDLQVSWLRTAIDFVAGERTYDLVLLDIGLPGISGMEAARLLRERNGVTQIIFITSLAQYAAQGYEVDALGFIVKPTTYAALSLYLGRSVDSWRRRAGRYATIPTGEGVRLVALHDIVFVEVRDHNLFWHLVGEEPIKVRGSLREVEKTFEGAPVLRVSKSTLVNMDKVTSIHHGTLTVSTGDEIALSRAHRRQTIGRLTTYLGGRE